eukprot:CAMPEP_0177721658 /NCGR_PEP_ID=MMETSP0484_2-20121128/17266_1 /TAXON_ID=354590 /ORGANISM="Rhodomonas lens, Strain RHODO" /LENGTH=165 /DNA_ID=CAMNT_0019233981 /DNA_START=148 /DNA_END=641 /DNA_ORIENTATION=-
MCGTELAYGPTGFKDVSKLSAFLLPQTAPLPPPAAPFFPSSSPLSLSATGPVAQPPPSSSLPPSSASSVSAAATAPQPPPQASRVREPRRLLLAKLRLDDAGGGGGGAGTCPLCRAPFPLDPASTKPRGGGGGYTNLGELSSAHRGVQLGGEYPEERSWDRRAAS